MRAYLFFSISKPWQRGMKAASATLKPARKECYASPWNTPCHPAMPPHHDDPWHRQPEDVPHLGQRCPISRAKMSYIFSKDVLYLGLTCPISCEKMSYIFSKRKRNSFPHLFLCFPHIQNNLFTFAAQKKPKKMTNPSPKADIAETLRSIKQELRTMMNGPVSQSMRQHGLGYRVIFGVEQPRLQAFAEGLLATMTMPPDEFDSDLGTLWAESLHYPEEADALAQNLLRHVPWATGMLTTWMASEKQMLRYEAFQLLACLLRDGLRLTTRDAQEFLDHRRAGGREHSCTRSASRHPALHGMRNTRRENCSDLSQTARKLKKVRNHLVI